MNQPPQPYPVQAPAPAPKKSNVGLILGIVAGLGCLGVIGLGVFAALGIYGTRSYLVQAKKAEGKNAVGMLVRGMTACMASEERKELPPSSASVPASLAAVSGKKYMSSPSDWTDPAFKCARFEMSMPQYFQYAWERTSPTVGIARAIADLDGDGTAEIRIEQELRCTAGVGCTPGPLVEK